MAIKIDESLLDKADRIVFFNDSSNIQQIFFFREKELMFVEFIDGNIYEYSNVSLWVFGLLAGSDSVGNAFSTKIKKYPVIFPYQKVEVERNK